MPLLLSSPQDDHDYGWNNGNARLPHKDVYKSMYLDAIGVHPDSPRRRAHRPAYHTYTYRSNVPGDEKIVEVVLLDERYDRALLPCHVRRKWCEDTVLVDEEHPKWGWCNDYLTEGEPALKGGGEQEPSRG